MTLGDHRQNQILDMLGETQEVQVARLAAHLQVSEMTIRRDLLVLEQRGRLKRVYGGAIATAENAFAPVAIRAASNSEQKEQIGVLAHKLMVPNGRVYLEGGSTVVALARRLASGPPGQFTTSSIEIAQIIAKGGVSDVTLLGGTLRRNAGTLIGPEALEMLERRTFDIAFVGITAIHPRFGFLDPTEWHGFMARTIRQRASQVVMLADHSKFTADSDIRSYRFDEVDIFVTDRPVPDSHAPALEAAGVRVIWPG